MLEIITEDLLKWAIVLFAGGTAWGGASMAIHGTKQKVKEIEANMGKVQKELAEHTIADAVVQTETIDRLARIETKLDLFMDERHRNR